MSNDKLRLYCDEKCTQLLVPGQTMETVLSESDSSIVLYCGLAPSWQ